MKIRHNLLILILFFSFKLRAQQYEKLDVNQIYTHVGNCLGKYYKPDEKALKIFCRRGCIFIKFKVGKKGQIENLAFSKDSCAFIVEALTKAIDSLKQDTQLINTLKESGKTIIQPFIYDYQFGCNFPKNKLEPTKEAGIERLYNYLRIRDGMEHYYDTIFNMLNFNDGKLFVIDCLLLVLLGLEGHLNFKMCN